jgi:CubicO group peptidase (beta-lactamase class C family)
MVQVPAEWQPQRRTWPSSAARDMAKVGQLVLQRRTWNGKQVVYAASIDSVPTPQNPLQLPLEILNRYVLHSIKPEQ